jgi:hypothetical protein
MADNLSKVNVTTNETVDGEVKEKSPPVFSFGGTYLTTGVQTTPNLARGVFCKKIVFEIVKNIRSTGQRQIDIYFN